MPLDLDIAGLKEALADLQGYYATRNAWFEEYAKAYLGDVWKTPPAPEEERVSLPTGYSIVETVRALLTARPPVFTVPPSREKRIVQERADRVEKYLQALWTDGRLEQEFREGVAWQFITLGWACMRVTWDNGALKRGDFPVVFQTVWPANVYPVFDRRGRLRKVFFVSELPVWEVREDFPKALPNKDPDDVVELVDYWELQIEGNRRRVVNAVFAGDEWVKVPVYMPRYPVLPYVIGRLTATRIPGGGEYEGMSLLYPIVLPGDPDESLLAYRNRLFSQAAQVVADYANPVTVVYTDTPAGEGGRPGFAFDTSRGAVNFLFPQERVEYLEWRGTPPAMQVQYQVADEEIQRATIPRIMYGQAGGDISGIALNILTTPAVSRIAGVQQSLRAFLEDVLQTALAITEANMPDTMPFCVSQEKTTTEEELRKSDLGGYYRLRVLLSANLPKDVPNMLALLIQLVRSGVLSRLTAADLVQQYLDTGITSPETEVRRVMMEEVLRQKEVLAAMGYAAAKQYGWPIEEVLGKKERTARPAEERGFPPDVLHARQAPATASTLEDQLRASSMPAPPAEGEAPQPYGTFPAPGGVMPENPLYPPGGARGPKEV